MSLNNTKIQIRNIIDFSEDECAMIIPYLNKKELKKGDYFIKENITGQFLVFVTSAGRKIFGE